MAPTTGNAANVAAGMLKISAPTVLTAVDGLDLRGRAKISRRGIPLRNLQHERLATFRPPPDRAITALLELLHGPLEKVIAVLVSTGHTELRTTQRAIDAVSRDGCQLTTSSVLAFAIAEEFPAAPHCRRLLDERADLNLPELPDVVSLQPSLLPRRPIQNQRAARRRREDEKKRKRGPTSQRPLRPPKPSRHRKRARLE